MTLGVLSDTPRRLNGFLKYYAVNLKYTHFILNIFNFFAYIIIN